MKDRELNREEQKTTEACIIKLATASGNCCSILWYCPKNLMKYVSELTAQETKEKVIH